MNGVGANSGGGTWNGTVYTVPKSGRYQVNFTGNFEGAAYDRWCQALIYVGATGRGEGGVNSGTGNGGFMGCDAAVTLALTAGQQVSFRVQQGVGFMAFNLITGLRNRSTSATISYIGD